MSSQDYIVKEWKSKQIKTIEYGACKFNVNSQFNKTNIYNQLNEVNNFIPYLQILIADYVGDIYNLEENFDMIIIKNDIYQIIKNLGFFQMRHIFPCYSPLF